MKVLLEIQDNKALHLLEVLRSLPYVKIFEEEEIPDEHKAIVRERIASAKPGSMVSWEEAFKEFSDTKDT